MHEFAALFLRHPGYAALGAGLFGVVALKVPPFALLSAALVALQALRHGWLLGVLTAAGAGLLVAVGWYFLGSRPGLDFPLVFALWPPLLVAAEVLRRTASQGLALVVVGFTAATLVLVMHALTGDVVAFWRAWLGRAVAAVPGATVRGFEENDTVRLMNGFMAVLYGLSLMLSLLLGRWLQSLVYHPGGFGAEFRRLRPPRLVLPLAVAAVWGAGYGNRVLMTDLFMVAMMLYFFVGLAVLHGVVAVRNLGWGWLAPVYLALVYFPQAALSGLALLGAVDSLVNFRDQQGTP